MEAIRWKLKDKASTNPSNALLNVIGHLEAPSLSWQLLRRDFDTLENEGIWEKSEENAKLLEELRLSVIADNPSQSGSSSPSNHYGRDVSIVHVPPSLQNLSSMLSSMHISALPRELVDVVNQVYWLHLLANEPESVLPPGKSLLSMVARPHAQPEHREGDIPNLRDKVENIVHRAFWDEALESLSNPAASSQIVRLQTLYKDLLEALRYLLPPNHPVLMTLGSPLSPTSSPLLSAIAHLREILSILRTRCASARDPYIDDILHRLDDANPLESQSALAKIVVDVVRSILKLADIMKDDLAQFVLGTMGERQLRAAITKEAKLRQRQVVTEIWGPKRIGESWTEWLGTSQGTNGMMDPTNVDNLKWIVRLVEALGSVMAVSCAELPSAEPPHDEPHRNKRNSLPPPLFFFTPSLVYAQNFLQALVIAGSLRSLTRLPPPPPRTADSSAPITFMERVWTLLRAEIDEEEGSGDIKLINLADEVVRARRTLGDAVDEAEETKLHAAVARTLQTHDPVYVLIQKRLLNAVSAALIEPPLPRRDAGAPTHLQSGRERPGKRPRLLMEASDAAEAQQTTHEHDIIVKGFEDPVLVRAIGEITGKLRSCVDWMNEVWADLIEEGEIANVNVQGAEA